MNALPRLSALFSTEKSIEIYSSYKYDDIKRESIIHEGNLEYLYGENLFKSSLFKKCFIVLTCFLNDRKEILIIIYLYSDKTKSPYKYFQLEKNDQLNDRCRKLIEGKTNLFFMELIISKTNQSEIFGARSVPERKLWIEKFDEAISKLKVKTIARSISDVHNYRQKSSHEECSLPVRSNPINYTPFRDEDSNDYLQPIKSLPINLSVHRSCIEPIDMKKINDYDEAISIPPSVNKIISWEKIFYNNIKDDFGIILSNIGQTGIYLIRPQLKKSTPNDHDYTLCVYDDGHIYKFGIYQLSNHQYRLIYRDNEPSFNDIPKLCQYYTIHPLHITLKEGVNKYIYLTFPYTHENLYY